MTPTTTLPGDSVTGGKLLMIGYFYSPLMVPTTTTTTQIITIAPATTPPTTATATVPTTVSTATTPTSSSDHLQSFFHFSPLFQSICVHSAQQSEVPFWLIPILVSNMTTPAKHYPGKNLSKNVKVWLHPVSMVVWHRSSRKQSVILSTKKSRWVITNITQ